MAENVQWIKLKVGMFDGNSFKKIKRAKIGGVSYRDKLTSIWFELMDLAGKGNSNGCLVDNNEIPYRSFEDIAIMLDREEKEIELCMNFYLSEKMIEIIDDVYCLTNFVRYQNQEGLNKIREQKRVAQAKWRERKKLGLVEKEKNVDKKISTQVSTNNLLSNSYSISNNNINIDNKENNNLIEYRIDKEEQLSLLCKEYITTRNNKSESRKNYYAYLDGKKVITGTKKLCKLNHIQILLATKQYVAECKNKDLDNNLVLLLSTFLNGRLLDYIEKTKSVYERVMEKQYGQDWRNVRYLYE